MFRWATRLASRAIGFFAIFAAGGALYRAGRLDATVDRRIRQARRRQRPGEAPVASPEAMPATNPTVAHDLADALPDSAPDAGQMRGLAVVAPSGPSAAATSSSVAARPQEAAQPLGRRALRRKDRRDRRQRARQRRLDMIDRTGRGYRAAGNIAITLVVAALFASFAIAGFSALTGSRDAAPVSTEDVAADFDAPATGGGTPFGSAANPAVEGGPAAPGATTADKGAEGSGNTGGGVALLVPPQGTYTYNGSGTETSVMGTTQQGPEIPATVKHTVNNCWEIKIHYHSERWDQGTYCAGTDGSLARHNSVSEILIEISFYSQTVTVTTTCDPPLIMVQPNMAPGTVFDHSCTIENSALSGTATSAGPTTFIGEETLDIGGAKVQAYRMEQKRTVTGAQTGSSTETWWFAKDNGMPLANERQTEFTSKLPFGLPGSTSTTEQGSFKLTSLQPV